MNRRQLLAGVVGCLLSAPVWAAPDVRLQDLELEQQISRAQNLCIEAGKIYRNFLNGRLSKGDAEQEVKTRLSGLEAFQKQAALLAVPKAQTSVRHWARLQKQELKFFLADIQAPEGQRRSQSELQKRWQNAVEIQADLLETRRRQLSVLETSKASKELAAYYRWKRSLLALLQAELNLARDVASAFESKKTDRFSGQAVSLALQAEKTPVPPSCVLAQSRYVDRFKALFEVCADAERAITAPDRDSVANLQDSEELYRTKAMASDDASLAALKGLLSKSR